MLTRVATWRSVICIRRSKSVTTTQTHKRSPEKNLEYRLRAEARHPEKIRARLQTHDALKRGKLIRQCCEQCGEAKAEAHHEDYSKPLAVRWLCKRCHTEVHRRTHCKRGHELSGHNVRVSVTRGGVSRSCRQCHTEATRKRLGKL